MTFMKCASLYLAICYL